MKKRGGFIFLVVFMLMVLPYVGAGVGDFLRSIFGGEPQLGPQGSQNVSVQVGNSVPTITLVQVPTTIVLNPSTVSNTTNVTINFTARDSNGASDLNDATAFARFNRTGEQPRNNTCTFVSQLGKERTYNCTISMWYYDNNGIWSVNVSIADSVGARVENTANSITIPQLKDISVNSGTISFPTVAPGGFNITSTINTSVTNNGNYDVPIEGSFIIRATPLVGLTSATQNISGSLFKAANTSSSDPCNPSEQDLTENTDISVPGISLPRGISGNNVVIAYCLKNVTVDISQTYSTTGGLPWIFKL